MATTTGVSGIGQDQFLQLLVAQLQSQDPLDPVSDKEFIGQLTSLNTLQGIQSLNANFAEMLKLQQLTQGTELLGKTVEYSPPEGGASRSGTVDAVAVQDGKFVLQVGTARVSLDQIVNVQN